MKKNILLLSLLLTYFFSVSQDTIRIKHTNYTTVFSKKLKYPVLVEWWETRLKIKCATPLKRKDNFKPDPSLLKYTDLSLSYKGSGYDRGHMMPAASNLCQTSQIQDECFYFSNMSPQTHSLNAGDWKVVETWTRDMSKDYDSIHIWSGNIGIVKKIGAVSVPKQLWKLIYIVRTKEWFGYMFENDTSSPSGIHSHLVSKEIIEKETGFKFR